MKWAALFLSFCLSYGALASSSFEIETLANRHQVTADRTLFHSREGVYEAFGNVVVSARGQRLSCDYLWVDEKTKEMKARGNVIFVNADTTVQAAEVQMNLDTGFGSIFYGKVGNDRYSLRGQLIRKVSEDRFLTTEGEYTTCKDCAESWKLAARNVDLTVDGYAFMDGVYLKIKDVPTLYVPYLIVPVKTRRQTGLLFPRLGAGSSHGFVFVQPLFLNISDHQDVTLSLGKYSSRGTRYEFEHRFFSYDGLGGTFNFFRTKDRKADVKAGFPDKRTAFRAVHTFPISKNLAFRWRVYEVLDRDYPYDFSEDMIGRGLPTLESNVVGNLPFDDFFVSVEAKRYRNLLTEKPTGFDGGTVQAYPTVHMGIKERPLLGPLLGGLYARYDVFKRHNGPIQDENRNRFYDQGQDSIREANRLIFQPSLSAPFRLGRLLQLSPSVQYHETRYDFSVPTADGKGVPDAETRYVQAKLEASTVFERVIDYDGERVKRLKHQISPFLTFSNIPWIAEGNPNHPFNGQVGQLQAPAGLFDQFDLVPLTNDTDFLRYPQGKSMYYGFTSRLIRKLRDPQEEVVARAYPFDQLPVTPKKYPKPLNRKMELETERNKLWDQFGPRYNQYQEIWTVNVSQAYDFKSAEHLEDKKRAFSYLLAKSDLGLDRFGHHLEYRFFPRTVVRTLDSAGLPTGTPEVFRNKHYVSTSFTWDLQNLQNLRRTRSFVRNVSGGFTISPLPNRSRTASGTLNWSINDFVNLKLEYNYDILAKKSVAWNASTILTHPSECWGVQLHYDWQSNRSPHKADIGYELMINLMGTGFLGAKQFQESGPAGVFGGM